MQIPILNGIYADNGPDLRTSYPVNLVPVPKQSGISAGFLRPGDGIVGNGTGPGIDRGGINWNGVCYRVMGTKLVTVASNGAVTVLGDVGGPINTLVTMDYSFDVLAIASGGRLYYWIPVNTPGTVGWNPTAPILRQVTDPDLGVVLDVVWVDGYFMTTDGANLVTTELSDPTQVNPLKYGSSEVDPDPVVALLKLRNEVYALNRNTIEVFDNVGGEFFPFQRIDGAQIQKGVIGTFGCCVFVESVAFLGSGRNEAPGIYLGTNATAQKISTREIDQILLGYTEAQLAGVKLEARNDKAHQHLYVHTPDRTLVFDAAAPGELSQPVWFTLTTSQVGYLVDNISSHWGQIVRWEFGTLIVYNESNGAIFNELELVSLTGSVALGVDPMISTSYSVDGQAWSQDRSIRAGTTGSRKRLAWFQQGHMRNWRIQRFRGDSQAHLSFIRLEAQIEPLAY
jgi:hypothetical protein